MSTGLGLTEEELDVCWALSADAEHPHREYARQLESALLRNARREQLALMGLTLLQRLAHLRVWARRATRVLAATQETLASRGIDADPITDLLADYAASWGQGVLD